jgi:hypothetical protein
MMQPRYLRGVLSLFIFLYQALGTGAISNSWALVVMKASFVRHNKLYGFEEIDEKKQTHALKSC